MSTSQTRRRRLSVYVRLDQSEQLAINRAAHSAGISSAAFVRRQALTVVGAAEVTPARRGGTSLPPEDIAAVAVLSGDVRRATGAIVQLAKALRMSGHTGFHALAESVLGDLRNQAAALTTIIERLK